MKLLLLILCSTAVLLSNGQTKHKPISVIVKETSDTIYIVSNKWHHCPIGKKCRLYGQSILYSSYNPECCDDCYFQYLKDQIHFSHPTFTGHMLLLAVQMVLKERYIL